ncbi:MAG: hypothetical protein WA738_20115 [Candidatus Angelobacter sp.]
MKFSTKSVGLLSAGIVLLSISLVAQQEVSPDHFDEKPAVAQKPAAHSGKAVASKKKPSPTHVAGKPKSQPAPSQAVAAAEPVQTASNR